MVSTMGDLESYYEETVQKRMNLLPRVSDCINNPMSCSPDDFKRIAFELDDLYNDEVHIVEYAESALGDYAFISDLDGRFNDLFSAFSEKIRNYADMVGSIHPDGPEAAKAVIDSFPIRDFPQAADLPTLESFLENFVEELKHSEPDIPYDPTLLPESQDNLNDIFDRIISTKDEYLSQFEDLLQDVKNRRIKIENILREEQESKRTVEEYRASFMNVFEGVKSELHSMNAAGPNYYEPNNFEDFERMFLELRQKAQNLRDCDESCTFGEVMENVRNARDVLALADVLEHASTSDLAFADVLSVCSSRGKSMVDDIHEKLMDMRYKLADGGRYYENFSRVFLGRAIECTEGNCSPDDMRYLAEFSLNDLPLYEMYSPQGAPAYELQNLDERLSGYVEGFIKLCKNLYSDYVDKKAMLDEARAVIADARSRASEVIDGSKSFF